MTDRADGGMAPLRAGVLTVSDSAFRGDRSDESGPALAAEIRRTFPGAEVEIAVAPDEAARIAESFRRWIAEGFDLAAATGGTGVSPRDRTPEALRPLLDIEIPGLPELMRLRAGAAFPAAYLSRQVAGIAGRTLVLALPGSPRGAAESLAAIAPLLTHVLELVRGAAAPHPAADGPGGANRAR